MRTSIRARGRLAGIEPELPSTPLDQQTGPPWRLLLRQHLSPGDAVVLTMALRSLHRRFPGEYLTDVDTPYPELWAGNPDVTQLPRRTAHSCRIRNRFGESDYRQVHLAQTHLDHLGELIARPVTLACLRPWLYLTAEEQAWQPPWPRYAVANFGGKSDMPLKAIPPDVAEGITRHLTSAGYVVVQTGTEDRGPGGLSTHPRIAGAVDYVGRTTLRELVRLTGHAALAVSGVTALHHIAAGVGVPSVCLNYREPSHFISYPTATVLSPVGWLPCVPDRACWAAHTHECRLLNAEGRPTCHVGLDAIGALSTAINLRRLALHTV